MCVTAFLCEFCAVNQNPSLASLGLTPYSLAYLAYFAVEIGVFRLTRRSFFLKSSLLAGISVYERFIHFLPSGLRFQVSGMRFLRLDRISIICSNNRMFNKPWFDGSIYEPAVLYQGNERLLMNGLRIKGRQIFRLGINEPAVV